MTSYKDELRHYGIKGQKRGKRRFQNEDGSLTAAGRARYGVSKGNNRHGILSVSDQRAGGGPKTKGKLSGAPVQRTTGNRNPREMSVGAARKVKDDYRPTVSGFTSLNGRNQDKNRYRVISRRNDSGRLITEYAEKDGDKYRSYSSDVRNRDGSTTYTNRSVDPRDRRVLKETWKDDPSSGRYVKVSEATSGPEKHEVLKGGKLVNGRTTGNRNPREMGIGAARKITPDPIEAKIGAKKRYNDKGQVVVEYPRGVYNGYAQEIISNTQTHDKNGRIISNVDTPRSVLKYKANDPRAQAVAAQRANAGVRTSSRNPREMSPEEYKKYARARSDGKWIQRYQDELKRKTREMSPEEYKKYARARSDGKWIQRYQDELKRKTREIGVGAARTTRNADGSTSRRTDNGDVVFERKRKDGTTEVIRQSARGDTRTVVGRNGATRESYKVVGEDDIRNKRTERGLRGEKHEVVKASKGGQSAKSTNKPTVSGSNNVTTWDSNNKTTTWSNKKPTVSGSNNVTTWDSNNKTTTWSNKKPTVSGSNNVTTWDSNNKTTTWSNKKTSGVAAVGKIASKQLSSVMGKVRSMAAKEAVKKGAVVKKKKKG